MALVSARHWFWNRAHSSPHLQKRKIFPQHINEHYRPGWKFLLEKEAYPMFTSEGTNTNPEALLCFPRSLLGFYSQGCSSLPSFHLCNVQASCFPALGVSPSFSLFSLSSFYTDCRGSDSAPDCHVSLPYLLPNKELCNDQDPPTFWVHGRSYIKDNDFIAQISSHCLKFGILEGVQ